jgi:SAM-dependent methyltransferase
VTGIANKQQRVSEVLACPNCHTAFGKLAPTLHCSRCGNAVAWRDGILFVSEPSHESFFDAHFETMHQGNRDSGVWDFCYSRQVAYLEEALRPDAVLVDVGCGPAPVYQVRPNWYVIGVEPSVKSLKANQAVDLRILGTAKKMPIATSSVDAVVCFYSIHHMVGERISHTTENVRSALRECRRVLRRGGSLFIFDMSPWWLAWVAQRATWNIVRAVLGRKLDMYFWHWKALRNLATESLADCTFRTRVFRSRLSITFPPIFSLPWFKLPRALYPMAPRLYQWTLPVE